MSFFKLTLAYDGTDFSGWQAQPDRRTVQGILQHAWKKVTGETVSVTATSRTDAGVHALNQVVGIETSTHLTAADLYGAINAYLPEDVVLLTIETAAEGFHATHDATGKRYRYRICNQRQRPLFERRFVWHVPQPLNVEAMRDSAALLVGKHDFASFQSAGSERESTVRTVLAAEVRHAEPGVPDGHVWIEVEGDGFLYNMVRIIVGTLVEVGLGKRPAESVGEVLAAKDRRVAGKTAPPQGLTLLDVQY